MVIGMFTIKKHLDQIKYIATLITLYGNQLIQL